MDKARLASLSRVAAALMMAIGACGLSAGKSEGFESLRMRMVSEQIAGRGIVHPGVLSAMRKVPRHRFVSDKLAKEAYSDYPLPIGHDQTISQPYIVAYMSEAVEPKKGQKILEIGTGSGYQAAVLAELGARVFTIEIIEPLGLKAKELLARLGYQVEVRIGDGYAGWPEEAPFDSIVVTAAPPKIPQPLVDQLKEGGLLVIPVGRFLQDLQVLRKVKGSLVKEKTLPVRFVPMTGQASS